MKKVLEKLPFLSFFFLTLFLLALSGGCSDGPTSVKQLLYLDGELHGELASALASRAEINVYDDKGTDKTLIISRPDEKTIDEATLVGAKATYEAGNVVALEHVNEDEVNSFLGQMGLEQNFKLDSPDVTVEIFAMERRGGHNFYYVTLNDDDGDVLISPDIEVRTHTIIGAENDKNGSLDVSVKTVSADMPLYPSDEIVQGTRTQGFLDWVAGGENRLAQINRDSKNEMSDNSAKNTGDTTAADLKELAEASVWTIDNSYKGQTFTLRYTIYSCHSFTTNDDYYIISQAGQLNPSVLWKRTQEGHVSFPYIYETKVQGQMRRYFFKNYWGENPGSTAPLVKSSPVNANNQSTVTSGFSWDLNGSVGFSGLSATGGLGMGATFSSSESFSISDCTVNDRCGGDSKPWLASWEYVFADPANGEKHFYWTDLKDASLLSRSNFQPINQWVWVVPRAFTEKDKHLYFKSEFTWTNGTCVGATNCFYIECTPASHQDWDYRYVGFWVPVKKPPLTVLSKGELDFTKAGDSKTLSLVSAKKWTTVSTQSWCRVQENSGEATGADGITLHVTADSNNSGANREAVITVSTTDGKDKAILKVFQSQY